MFLWNTGWDRHCPCPSPGCESTELQALGLLTPEELNWSELKHWQISVQTLHKHFIRTKTFVLGFS